MKILPPLGRSGIWARGSRAFSKYTRSLQAGAIVSLLTSRGLSGRMSMLSIGSIAPRLQQKRRKAIGPESKLSLQPHLQLLELSYPVDSLVLAVKKHTPETEIVSNAANRRVAQTRPTLPAMRQERVWLAVHRFEDSVYYRRVDRETFLLLSALRSGASVSEAVTLAFEKTRLNAEEQANVLRESFAHASQLGWFCTPYAEDESEALIM